jgi:type II restriction/modification system DNA methylase subunit YeeA
MSPITPQQFVQKWKAADLTERASAQTHFLDICQLLGQPDPISVDPTGKEFAFEKGVAKGTKGGQGWADVWKKGYFAWEYKRNRASLAKAYEQLQLYRESLENPPLLVVSDNLNIEVHTNFTNSIKSITKFTLDDFLDPKKLNQLKNVFTNPEAFRSKVTVQEVTESAAKKFSELAEILRANNIPPNQAAHFLIRLLFCLFAEDIALLPTNLFSKLVQNTRFDPAAFVAQLQQLFRAMKSGGYFGVEKIVHFNGGLFDNDEALALNSKGIEILFEVSKLDWSVMEPAILGTLFERSLDPSKRKQLGAHYTSREDILLIVEPVLMAPFRRRWEEIKQEALELASKRDAASGGQRTTLNNRLAALLTGYANEIAQVQVLDPACGSGNFLYVALKQLLDLEKEVVVFAQEVGLPSFFPAVSPLQLHGIEINEYAHELAQITIWIGYIQWLRDNGFGQPEEPILKPLQAIIQMDAILAYDENGKPVEPEWPKADVIIGNPPFLGSQKMRRELGDKYTVDLWGIFEGRIPRGGDFVTYWFEKTRNLVASNLVKRAGLLATQSIRAGASRIVLERINQTGNIFIAWSDRSWILDGASVRISMVGFDNGNEATHLLNGNVVSEINTNLSSEVDVTQSKILKENAHIIFKGDSKTGPFEINSNLAQILLNSKGNPNGRSNKHVVRPWINGLDVTGRPRNMWIIDFGVGMLEQDAAMYEAPFEYLRKNVYPERIKNTQKSLVQNWWLHDRPRPTMRKALIGKNRYIVTPRVAKHRIFIWANIETLPDSRLYVFARDDDYFLGILHSSLHEIWSLATSSRHGVGNDPTYNSTTCFETYPFPWPPSKELADNSKVEAIAQAARELVQYRDNWLNPTGLSESELKKRTLTNLYNQRPTWLDNAHKKLDKAVLDAYGWPHNLTDEQVLERLLTLNLERVAAQGEIPIIISDEEIAD